MTDLQMLGNSFFGFGLVSTYQRFSAAFLPKSAPFWKLSSEDAGPAALVDNYDTDCKLFLSNRKIVG